MKTALDHLPASKRRQLGHVVRVLFEEFEIATRLATQDWKAGRILKVILYGSHARGDWVDDPVGRYTSDYDILVVVNDATSPTRNCAGSPSASARCRRWSGRSASEGSRRAADRSRQEGTLIPSVPGPAR